MQLGAKARHDMILREIVERDIALLEHTLEEDTLAALAWLVADGVLDFKLALPRNKLERGEFHDKFGVFSDAEGNQVSFNGSYNDSVQGTRNYESIKVFSSWRPELLPLVQDDVERFEQLWNGRDPNVSVYDLPQAAREQIVRLRTKSPRPYPRPAPSGRGNGNTWDDIWDVRNAARPHMPPHVALRDYQEEALNAWLQSGCRGLLEMATGTGKTITALAGAVRLFEREKRLLIVICCPFKHLVEQWAQEAQRFGLLPIRVAESKERWEPDLTSQLRDFGKHRKDVITIVTTNAALQKGPLPKLLEPYWERALITVDEAHYAGAPTMQAALPPAAPWRLGLTATPIRHYDEEGSTALLEYFSGIIFQFGLKEAIGPFLTPYYYYPVPVEMTLEEFDEFSELTRRLQRYGASDEDRPISEQAKKIAILRARVMNNSTAKLDWLREHIEPYAEIGYTLFYVGEKLFEPSRELLGVQKRLRIHEFTHKQNNRERKEILERFAGGELQALVAMKCLDEGVDVPPTRTAYFLASSGNPREFIQRRGRVLRKSEGKEYAVIYDLVSMPPYKFIYEGATHPDWAAIRSAVRREYRRIKSFAELAENRYQALDGLFEIVNRLDLLEA